MKVGNILLSHRVALAPMTRLRATASHVPFAPLVKEYYSQRVSLPGSLLITEATIIAPKATAYPNIPGIYNDEQIAAWKVVGHIPVQMKV